MGRKKALPLALLSLAVAGLCIALTVYAMGTTAVVEDGPNGPTAAVEEFFSRLRAGDWDAAYALLSDGRSLGLEQSPEDTVSALFWTRQRESWDCAVDTGYTMVGTRLQKQVQVQCLDFNALGAALGPEVQRLLDLRTEEAKLASEVYDEAGAYRPEVAQWALETAAETLLEDLSPYLCRRALTVELEYAGGQWKIMPDAALLRELTGGAVG